MLPSRLIRSLHLLPRRTFSGDHHERILDDYDGVNRRINRVVRHDTEWETVYPVVDTNIYRDLRINGPYHTNAKAYWCTIGLSSFMWAWLFYHFYYEGHELYSKHYPNPDLDALSDEYLGIPPDEAGLAPEKKWVKTQEVRFAPPSLTGYPKDLLRHKFGDEGPFKF